MAPPMLLLGEPTLTGRANPLVPTTGGLTSRLFRRAKAAPKRSWSCEAERVRRLAARLWRRAILVTVTALMLGSAAASAEASVPQPALAGTLVRACNPETLCPTV